VFERGDVVAALLLNRDSFEVVLVEQFRAPTMDKSRNQGWMTEVVAGIIDSGETPEQALAREVFEETGYRIQEPEPIATFFSSPGGSSERIFLYYAVVADADRTGPGGGKRAEGEDIRIVTMSPGEVFRRLAGSAIDDPKLIIAAYHLRDRVKLDPRRPTVLGPDTVKFAMKGKKANRRLVIGIKTGDILNVEGVDVWVNSENTDMMMDRIIDKSISARIRYAGAEKDDNGAVRVDTIANDLRRVLGGRVSVAPATVLDTEAGELAARGVRRIAHVAAVHGVPGKGTVADENTISTCAGNVLEYIHRRNRGFLRSFHPLRSVLLPLLGTGEGGLGARLVAPRLVAAAVEFYQRNAATELTEIHLLAYTEPDRAACMEALRARSELEPMEPDA
jgi:nudix-type nucleoside diphosphatase (YffH/AdpP family)